MTVNELPTIVLGVVNTLNTRAISFDLQFSAATGNPNQYSLVTVAPNVMAGFSPINNALLGSSPIVVPIPPSSENIYSFNIVFKNTITGCASNPTPFDVLVLKENSTIEVTGATSYYFNGLGQGPSTHIKTGSVSSVNYYYSGVGATVYSSSLTPPTAIGNYQVFAILDSDANYNSAISVAFYFSIIPAPSTIVVTGPTSFFYNGKSQGPSSNIKTGSSGAVTYIYEGKDPTIYGPSILAPINAGTYKVMANLEADNNFYGATSASLEFDIQKIKPTLELEDIVKFMGDPTFKIMANSNSNGEILYSLADPNLGVILGDSVSLLGIGISTITVTQAETINYTAAITKSLLTVKPSVPIVENGTYVLGSAGNPLNTNLLINRLPGAKLNFYSEVNGGSPSDIQPLPDIVGIYTFYVSQTINGIEGPRVKYVITILPEIKVRNATYIIGGSKNPTNISSLVTFITKGSKPQWCDKDGNNCTDIAPALPTTAGVTIWCVKAIDTLTGLESSPCVYDTVKMIAPTSVMSITKVASKPLLNSDGTFNLQYKFTLSNLTSELLDSIQVTDDLRKVFVSPITYEIISLKVGNKLTANSSYNGNSEINLLGYQSQLSGFEVDTIILTVKIAPNGYFGAINNTALISGVSPLFGIVGPVDSKDLNNSNNTGSTNPTVSIIPEIDVIIPSGFSPNNDGINDSFVIIRPFNSNVSLEVFNRWGNIVYKNSNYNNDWFGIGVDNFLGQELPDGTYFYVVKIYEKRNNKVKNFNGYLLLKR